tara:strand:+ start:166 stop:492 length:327 start_codon:yes stop_codon:yes gene_type:complete
MKVGDKIWRFDINRRRYREGGGGGPIYAEHWSEIEITGETSRSWIVGGWQEIKVSKRGAHYGYVFTRAEVEDDIWMDGNRYKLGERVKRCIYIDILKAIEALIEGGES